MLVFPELSGQLFEKMLFSTKILGHHTEHINISVEAVSLQPKTAKDFHAVPDLLEVDGLIFSGQGHINHPLVDDFPELVDDLGFEFPELLCVIIVPSEDVGDYRLVFLILLGVTLLVDHLEWVSEGLEVLVWG